MPSDDAKRRKAAKATRGKPSKNKGSSSEPTVDDVAKDLKDAKISHISCTGVLASHPLSRDLKVENFSLMAYSRLFVTDTTLELNYGRRYGLIGSNGCGKSTLLQAIANREFEIPEHMNIYHHAHEQEPSDLTALECVLEPLNEERIRIEKQIDYLMSLDDISEHQEALDSAYEHLDELDAETATARAASILHGLGFSPVMQRKKSREFSGGWRQRIALAKALFMRPSILLLDEPTNHLDLEACVWLEDYLSKYNRILLLVSHSQDFLNGVCTNICLMQRNQLIYYSGNYDTYVQTRAEIEENQMKQYRWEQDQIAHMKDYIARFGHGSAKLARQAQSKEKVLAKMTAAGLTEKVHKEKTFSFRFDPCGTLPPPILQFVQVSFGYPNSEKGLLYSNLDFGVDLDSRIALVGPNGAGKSTLLKLMVSELVPTDGQVKRHPHLRIARYHQHLADQLDMDLTPLEFMDKAYPNSLEMQQWRSAVGRFGITGDAQTAKIRTLSDGLKSRVAFAWIAWRQPHLLLLDEPTNHLDIETIDALADAINEWDGGMVLVSHDFRLISQVAREIWVCDNKTVTRWEGDITSYKNALRKSIGM